jgi:septation ring formation regulator EzrA
VLSINDKENAINDKENGLSLYDKNITEIINELKEIVDESNANSDVISYCRKTAERYITYGMKEFEEFVEYIDNKIKRG